MGEWLVRGDFSWGSFLGRWFDNFIGYVLVIDSAFLCLGIWFTFIFPKLTIGEFSQIFCNFVSKYGTY